MHFYFWPNWFQYFSLAKHAFDDAIAELDTLSEECYKDLFKVQWILDLVTIDFWYDDTFEANQFFYYLQLLQLIKLGY